MPTAKSAARRHLETAARGRFIGALRATLAISATAACGAPVIAQVPQPIVIDGRFDDWSRRPTLLVDPPDADGALLDLGRIAIDDDPHWLHLLVDVRRPVSLQQLDGRLMLLLDSDGDEETGSEEHGMTGVDLVIHFTPESRRNAGQPGMGVGIEWLADGQRHERSPYTFELAFAPTTASDLFEIRMLRMGEGGEERPERPVLDGERLRARWLSFDRAGTLVDETVVVGHVYSTRAEPFSPPSHAADPLAMARGAVARMVSWNVEHGSMLRNPEPFERILRAIQPDVLLLQEVRDSDAHDELLGWLDETLPGRPWTLIIGAAGGNLRSAVASRLPMQPVSALEAVTYELDGNARDVRTAAAIVDVAGTPTLVMSVHLKCCGGANGPEDRQRRAEMTAIAEALRRVVGFGDPVVVGGDYNLVGSRDPMRPLTVEWGLLKADLRHLDDRGVATWFDADSPFTPGRLDYMLHCNASLRALGGFVLDTQHLAPRWLGRHGLERNDVRGASDHFPLVLDLAPQRHGPRGAPGGLQPRSTRSPR